MLATFSYKGNNFLLSATSLGVTQKRFMDFGDRVWHCRELYFLLIGFLYNSGRGWEGYVLLYLIIMELFVHCALFIVILHYISANIKDRDMWFSRPILFFLKRLKPRTCFQKYRAKIKMIAFEYDIIFQNLYNIKR